MASLKSFIVLAALAASICQQVVAKPDEVSLLCYEMSNKVGRGANIRADSKAAFHSASEFIAKYRGESETTKKALLEALNAVFSDAECSASSYQHILYATQCSGYQGLEALTKATERYVNKCLKVEDISKAIRAAISRPGARRVNFVDERFIKKYYLDNPNDVPLHLSCLSSGKIATWEKPRSCCQYDKSFGAVNDAIERGYARLGKNAKKALKGTIMDVLNYLTGHLFDPCGAYVYYYRNLAKEIIKATFYYTDGQEAMIAKLAPEDKNVLFRYKYCELLKGVEYLLQEAVESNFQTFTARG